MHNGYADVTTRFLRDDERLIVSEEKEMPLVIEAKDSKTLDFLKHLLSTHSEQLKDDLARYGAVLLRGFDIHSDEDFEKTILSIQGFKGIGDAFMSEEGRIHVGSLKYVLHTNAVYKTGGTLYLGGFHSENYYSADVPEYISFCCLEPSLLGGETGLINMEKIYKFLDPDLKNRLEKKTFFVSKWLVSDIANRYHISEETVEKIGRYFDLPIIGKAKDKFVLMYKPSVFVHPRTKQKALQINFFEILTLNKALRKHFLKDYPGKTWFWHRVVWRLPESVLKILEFFYVMFASFFYSPKASLNILKSKIRVYKASHKKGNMPAFDNVKVGQCFEEKDVNALAKLMRDYYCSCLWKKGDILLVDNRLVVHAGMPGAGQRIVRALIGNPIAMNYSSQQSGLLDCQGSSMESIGVCMAAGALLKKEVASQDVRELESSESN